MTDQPAQFDDLELLDLLLERDRVAPTKTIDPAGVAGAPPTLSRAQRRIWFLQQMAPESPAYNMLSPVRLSGRLDLDALHHSLSEIVRRHDALRTCFPALDGRPGIAIAGYAEPAISIEDLAAIEPARQHERVLAICDAEARRPFDLYNGPLLRLRLLRLAEREHVALLGLHHIVADGWSMGVLIREFSELYTAFVTRRPARLATPGLGYAAFAAWQEQWLEGEAAQAQRGWWIERLDSLTKLELPTDRVRPAEPSHGGGVHVLALPDAVAEAVQDIGRQEGATLYVTMLAALAVLLHRYSGQEDIVVGSPVANRGLRETESMIGLFVNSLVMRCDLAGRPSFVEVLRRVRDYSAQALAHGDLPFDELVKALAPDRDLSANPLFQVMVSVDSSAPDAVALPDLTLTPLEVTSGVAKFDLQFNVTRSAAGTCTAAIEYATELFDDGTIRRMAGHFVTLLAAIAISPEAPVGTLPMLTEAERRQFDAWNHTATDYPRDACLASLFERQVRGAPDAIAVECGSERLTYQTLNSRANRLARRLRASGVGIGTTVAIHARRSAALIVGLVAIVKAGGAYVPLDPSYPPQRLAHMLDDCGAAILLTERGLLDRVPGQASGVALTVICIDDAADHAGDDADPDWPAAGGEDLAYVIYTSGSTGRPKGVAVPHRAVARLVLAANYVTLRPDDVVALASNVSFDAATFEVWGTLLNGARLVGIDQEVVLAPPLLARFLREHGVTTLFLTTALFNQVARDMPDAFGDLRHLLFGGEQADPNRVRDVLRHGPPRRLLHVYGPTENTTFSTWKEVSEVAPDAVTVPIGNALSNTTLHVLDANRQPVPVGVPGELYLGGDGLALGYYRDQHTTDTAFITDPSDLDKSGEGKKLYCTGDIVRLLPDGDIVFLGRRDSQVKIRGYRIEPGEIETVLLGLPSVREAAVLARQDRPGQIELVAYVAGVQQGTPDPAALRQALAAQLPAYMVPGRFVVLPALPLNENGKLDRRALPAPSAAASVAPESGPASRLPRDKLECCLADAWADVLGCAAPGLDDNYFALGGDSITAIQVVSRLRRAGWQVRVAELFRHPTIAQLGPYLRPLDEADDELPGAGDRPAEVALTAIQRWFIARAGDANHFNQTVLLRASDPVDEAALRGALDTLLDRHDALRLVLAGTGPDLLQFAARPGRPAELVVSDLRHDDDPAGAMERQAAALQRGLDLRDGKLMQAALFRRNDGDRVLLAIHHMAVDAVSWRILLDELGIAYGQGLAGHNIELGAGSCSFRRWAAAVRSFADSAELAAEAPYWAAVEAAEVTRLPIAEPAMPWRHGDVETVSSGLAPDAAADKLPPIPRALHAEIMEVLLTALGRALKNWSGGAATLVSLEGHGREPPDGSLDLSSTVGWFTSLYPFVLDVPGEDIGAQLEGVRAALRQVPRKGIGYGILRHVADSGRHARPAAGPQLCFNYLGQFEDGGGPLRIADEPIGPAIGADIPRAHALDLTGLMVGGRLLLSLDFDPSALPRATAATLLDDIRCQIIAVVCHCEQTRGTGRSDPGGPGPSAAAATWAHLPVQGEVQDAYPLSPLQHGLLFQSLLDGEAAAYFVQVQFEVAGAIDEPAFRQAWNALSQRHAVLRSAFVHEDLPQPLQVVLRNRTATIDFIDQRHLTAAERAAWLDAYCGADRSRGFDLRREPLLRLAVIRAADRTWRIVWSYHHILIDGWCLAVLQRDFLALYTASLGQRAAMLPPAPPYRRYIDWLDTQDRDAARGFWRRYLEGYDRIATVPRSAPIGDGQARSLGEQLLELDRHQSTALARLAARHQVTLSVVLRALWGVLLACYNDCEDVVFGTIVSGRPAELPGVEEMIGLFIAAVPVRVTLQPQMTFAALVRRLQDDALASEPHHHLSLADIQSGSSLGRTLFDHMLIFENYPMRATGEAGAAEGAGVDGAEAALSFTPVAAYDPTHYDLDVAVAPGDRIAIKFTFDRHIHDPEQMRRMASHLRMAATSVIEDPDRPLHEIAILPAEEAHLVLRAFNATGDEAHPGRVEWPGCVEMFARHVAATPDAIAVVCGDVALSYRVLDDAASRLARHLCRLGVGPGVPVGLCVERTPDMIIGPLAIWQAGGIFVPLAPDYPRERLGYMMADAGVALLLTQRELARRLAGQPGDCAAKVVCLDDPLPEHDRAARNAPGLDHTAYVIFTSGSTGRPKGVAVSHGNLASMTHAWSSAYDLGDSPVHLLQMASFSFDVFIGDLVRALCHGGTLVVCPAEALADPAALYGLMTRHGISILEATPAVVLPLMQHIERNDLPLEDLKTLIIGSDVLLVRHFRGLAKRFGDRMRLFNSYGVTEATIDASCFAAQDANALDLAANTPIGRPLDGVRLYVLDRHGRPQPIGVPGELFIGGAGVAQGYVNRPELTEERYVTRAAAGTQRLYRTGDLTRWLPDGNMEFLGRIDDQVKIRGYRIEPGEIEDKLLHCPGVRAAVVVARELGAGNELVGYVEADTPCDVAGLRAALRQTLPDHMVPGRLMRLDRMPLSANGKIDRRALPDPRGTSNPTRASLPPRSATERSLVAIWQDVLQTDPLGVSDDFFALGGHSLKAMQITARVHQQLGVRLALRELFGAPTIAELVALIDAAGRAEAWSHIPPAPPQDHYPLSHAQQRLWMLHHMEGAAAYNMPEAHIIDTMIDAAVLNRALRTLIDRHEVLRTAFILVDGEPRQQIRDDVAFAVAEFDLRHDAAAEAQARAIADRDAIEPLDLAAPPLLRASLVHLPEQRSLFVLTVHHIVGDGWSGNLVYRELLALYDAYRQGRPNPLKPLRIQYKDFSAWQTARGFERLEAYWLDRLSDIPAQVALPYDFAPDGARDFAGGNLSVELGADTLAGLRRLAVQRRTTLSSVVLALFKLFLFQWTRQDDLCVGMSVANRSHPDLENLIGFFVNVLPIRCRLSDDMEFDDLLTVVIERTQEALEHEDYPFDLMIQRINPTRQANRQPLVNVIYGFQNFADVHVAVAQHDDAPPGTGEEDRAVDWRPFEFSFQTSKFDLTLFVLEEPDRLCLTFEYDSGLFLASTIRQQLETMAEFAELIASQGEG